MREIVIAYDGKRYRVFFREGAIESYVHYRKTLQGAKSLARLWQEEEIDSGLRMPRIHKNPPLASSGITR